MALRSDDRNARYEFSSVWPLQPQTIIMNFNLWASCSFLEYLHILFRTTSIWCAIHTIRFGFSPSSQPFHFHLVIWYFIWRLLPMLCPRCIFDPHLLLWFIVLVFFISFPDSLLHLGFSVTFYKWPLLKIGFTLGSLRDQCFPYVFPWN